MAAPLGRPLNPVEYSIWVDPMGDAFTYMNGRWMPYSMHVSNSYQYDSVELTEKEIPDMNKRYRFQ